MKIDNRFEDLLVGLTPVLDEVVPPKKEGNDILAKRTYVIAEFVARIYFPAGMVYKDMPAEGDKPAYGHGTVAGSHVHLLEGATKEMVENEIVKVQLRLRTVEPIVDREGAQRNYEVVTRIVPNLEKEPATKQLWIDPAESHYTTIVNPRIGKLVHKGADMLMQDYFEEVAKDDEKEKVVETIATALEATPE